MADTPSAGAARFQVPPLSSLCLATILRIVQAHKYHPQLINDICRYLQGAQHLLNPILEHLIEKKVITDVALSAFLIPHRVHLNLTNCPHIKKSTLKQIGFNCPSLLALNLSDCQQVSNAVVRGILAGCSQLRELRLDRCRMVTDSAFDPDQSPFHMLVGCQSLENISLQVKLVEIHCYSIILTYTFSFSILGLQSNHW
jgi:F-box/leucine-rich repeat protein 2/20